MYKLEEVVIELTKKCNLNCIHCGSGCSSKYHYDELAIIGWFDIITDLASMGAKKIVFSGGEPTQKNGLGELLWCANVNGLKAGFISNGLIPFSDFLQKDMGQSKPFAVGLSIDGLKDTHNSIRRNKESWSGIMQNISILQNIGIQICAVTTLHKMNYPEMEHLAEFLCLVEVDSWQLQLAMPCGRMREYDDLLLGEEEFMDVCYRVSALRKAYPEINIQAADCFGPAPAGSIRSGLWTGCSAGISSMGIDACGNVMPCLSLQGCERTENVRAKPICEIWERSPIFDFNRKFKTENVKGRCENCTLLPECRGGCASQSFSYYGCFHSSPFCFTRSFCE